MADSQIVKTPGTCGGDARIAGTRIPVWGLVERRQHGMSDGAILADLPGLTAADLAAAWHYASDNPLEIDQALWLNDAIMIEHVNGQGISSEFMRRGLELGLDDDTIRTAFVPPLSEVAFAIASGRRLDKRASA